MTLASGSSGRADTIVDILRWRAQEQPDERAYVFLVDGELDERSVSYGELDRQARTIARRLLASHRPGDRVLLLYPPGLEFIAAFFGALYAGIVAVPAYPPRNNSQVPRLEAIMADAAVSEALTTAKTFAQVRPFVTKHPRFGELRWITTDDLVDDSGAIDAVVTPDTLALLQYTSGSTGTPKGVMVSHSNIAYNSLYIQQSFSLSRRSVSASWLPSFHDMGLIDGVIQPLYTGFLGVILPPVSFVQKPVRWLAAVSKYRATHGGGPNFGYDLCVQKVTEEQSAGLDLSSWASAYNGAEPVRPDTLRRFADRFAANGVRLRTLYPCYGLAETTLMVSGGHVTEDPVFCTVEKPALERDRVVVIDEGSAGASHGQLLVSSGRMILETTVRIVDGESGRDVESGRVGEVWVAGPTVCQGYWQRPDETRETFGAIAADGTGPYLRTGDLGFIHQRELFITGRAKDLIIIRGRNLYPQDVEAAVDTAHPAVRPGAGIAFSLDRGEGEQLVVVTELQRQALKNPPIDDIAQAIVKAVAGLHDVEVAEVVLVKTGTIPKTSSGKLQRRKGREQLLSGELEVVGQWSVRAIAEGRSAEVSAEPASETAESVAVWLTTRVAARVKRPVSRVDRSAPFSSFGLDSLALVELSGELSTHLDRELAPTLLYDFPTIDRLSAHVAGYERAAASTSTATTEPIAIVGVSVRLPGGITDLDSFWRVLRNGVDTISAVPAGRWPTAAASAPRFAGVINDIDRFDAEFFGIAPREAAAIDPQQRLLLELTWEALESGGIAPDRLAGTSTGVFVGISTQDYLGLQLRAGVSAYTGSGNALSAAAGRISYVFGCEGPSLIVDTACSSSLVAVHLACQSLRRGESTTAIVGGVNLLIAPELGDTFAKAGMMSADGRCKTFDARADGYVRSEGGVVVVLKPLSRAEADSDRVFGVIRGTAVNQDGRSNGLTAPNGPSQERVIRAALADADRQPSDISYVEAHGTGTSLGDPIEVRALGAVFGDRQQPLAIGSVKTNLGHLEAAAGLAGLVKVLVALDHAEIPPTLHLTTPNPHIPWGDLPVVVPTTLSPWNGQRGVRCAGVSSFGFTGTNAHVVVEQAPIVSPSPPARDQVRSQLLVVSARQPGAVQQLARAYADALDAQPRVALDDLCLTAGAGRAHFEHRIAVTGTTASELAAALRARALAPLRKPAGSHAPVAWMFTGQGSQRAGMGARLYATEPAFRAAIDRCDTLFQDLRGVSLTSLLFDATPNLRLNDTEWTQPALFALELALAELWQHWGVAPAAVIGHSVGEFVAAVVAGVFSADDGLRLVTARGQLMQQLPAGGGMLSVFASEQITRDVIAPFDLVAVAAINAIDEVVVSGPQASLDRIAGVLTAKGITARPLVVSHAFHSKLMLPARDGFAKVLADVRFSLPKIDLISNLTGKKAGAEIATPDYWIRHLLEPVRFRDGLETMASMGIAHYLELGPHPVLSSLGARNSARSDDEWLASMRPGVDESAEIVAALGRLYEAGVSPNWTALYSAAQPQRASLPTYAFQRERYWIDTAPASSSVQRGERHPVLGYRLPEVAALPQTVIWQVDEPASRELWKSYRVGRHALLPTSAFVDLIDAAGRVSLGDRIAIERVSFVDAERAIVAPDLQLQVTCRSLGGQIADVAVQMRVSTDAAWTEVASARVRVAEPASVALPQAASSIDLGVMFFNGADTGEDEDRYRLVLETARFADQHGFSSIWVPERHYTAFGGLYPNPAVLHAALARETRQIRLMAGSVVLPLHHPLRAAEDWALVDNLSNGRVGISVASGWNPDDFAMFPDRYNDRRDRVFNEIPMLQRLWRGESADATSGTGKPIRVRTYPAPVQRELPLWVTAAGNPDSFARAGAIGANLLTHLLDQDATELAGKIAVYRESRQQHGHDPAAGRVTIMIHTFLGDDVETVREQVRAPYCQYIKDNIGLLKGLAYSRGTDFDLAKLSPADVDEFVGFLYDRFFATRALLGTPESCLPLVRQLADAGVNEIACLVDFGPPTSLVVRHLPHLARLRAQVGSPSRRGAAAVAVPANRIATIQSHCAEHFASSAFYRRLRSRGINLGDQLQGAQHFWRRDGESLVQLEPASVREARTLELALQAFVAAIPSAAFSSATEGIFVTTSLRGFEVVAPEAVVAWSHATLNGPAERDGVFVGRVELLSEDGAVVARIGHYGVKRVALDTGDPPVRDSGLYEVAWEPKPFVPGPTQPGGVWLVLADGGGVAADVTSRLEAAGHVVITRRANDIDLINAAAAAHALAAIVEQHGTLSGVLHAWSLDAPDSDVLTDASLDQHQALGCGALLHVVQALSGHATPPRLWIVTRNAQPAGDSAVPTAVAQALVWGFGRAIAVEHPDMWGGAIDLSPERASDEAASIVAELLTTDGEDQVAYRRGTRRVPRLIARDAPSVNAGVSFDPSASYLITGGVGGLGRHVARWMIDNGATDLVLTGLRDRAANDPARELARDGVRVEVVAADASDRVAMAAIFDRVAARGKVLKGIVHLAGLPEDAPIADTRYDHGRRVMAPKVAGGWIVHELSRALPLDFFVAFSSISAVWGSRGQPFYGAANHFLDALTAYRRMSGLPMVTVSWGPWSEGGMVDVEGLMRLEQMGLHAMPPPNAIDRLALLIAASSPPRVVVDVDWPVFKELFESRGPKPMLERVGLSAVASAGADTDLTRELRGLDGSAMRARVGHLVHQQVAAVLGWSDASTPDVRRGFFDLGMDSLMALDLKNRLQDALGLPLRATVVFNYSTVDTLADFLARQLAPAASLVPVDAVDVTTDDLTTLSDDETMRMLDQQLAALESAEADRE